MAEAKPFRNQDSSKSRGMMQTEHGTVCGYTLRPRPGGRHSQQETRLPLYAEGMQQRPRVLGLDIGDRRVGIALSDPFGSTAQPLLTMGRSSLKRELKNIARLIRKHAVAEIVAGNPLHLSGDLSPQAVKAQAYAEALRAEFQLPVHLQDERLTSSAAHELMDRLGHPRGPERRAVLDQYAAVILLQDWLDARSHGGSPDAQAH